jgi:hypothetical protein
MFEQFDEFKEFDGRWEINYEVEYAKFVLGIDKPNNSELTLDEAKRVCRQIGSVANDTLFEDDGTPIFNMQGLMWMVMVCLYCFPKYYGQLELSQPN